MCVLSAPDIPPVQMPTERQAARAPDAEASNAASRRATDRLRGASSTVLTSQSGVTQNAATGGKTLLGS